MQIPEHTWGFDTKTFLHDQSNWTNKDFHAQLDAHAQNYEDNVAQWQRQRGYMTWAVEALDQSHSPLTAIPDVARAGARDDGLRAELAGLEAELRRQHELTDLEGYEEHPVGEPLRLKSQYWQIEVNTTTGKCCYTDPLPTHALPPPIPLPLPAAPPRVPFWQWLHPQGPLCHMSFFQMTHPFPILHCCIMLQQAVQLQRTATNYAAASKYHR